MGGMTDLFSNGQQEGYQDWEAQLQNALNQAGANYSPYMQAGTSAIPQYQDWLNQIKGQQNGNWMNSYQQSPYAQYLTNKELTSANNAAAAGGMLGSGVNQQDNMNIANQISAQDMQNFFNNMQSQNTMYGGGINNLMGQGFNAADSYSKLMATLMSGIGEAQYGQHTGQEQGKNSIIGNLVQGAGSAAAGAGI